MKPSVIRLLRWRVTLDADPVIHVTNHFIVFCIVTKSLISLNIRSHLFVFLYLLHFVTRLNRRGGGARAQGFFYIFFTDIKMQILAKRNANCGISCCNPSDDSGVRCSPSIHNSQWIHAASHRQVTFPSELKIQLLLLFWMWSKSPKAVVFRSSHLSNLYLHNVPCAPNTHQHIEARTLQ